MTLPPAIFGIGRNYPLHAIEMGTQCSTDLTVFMKNPASIIANHESILIPTCCFDTDQVDYEGELAIQIANDCCDVSTQEAMSYVGGYAVANDITARIWQKTGSGGQWVRGKSFNTFCPITTFIPASEVPNPHHLTIQTKLNGACVQEGNTSQMVRRIPELISELSRDMTILGGTIILTGTPAGVGVARSPQRFLQVGDVIEVIIERVGHLRNDVQLAKAQR